MKSTNPSRRQFLASTAGLAAGAYLPGLSLARPRPERRRALVLIELQGGLDALTGLVPHTDDAYYRARPTQAIPRGEVLRLDDEVGLPPTMGGVHQLWRAGRLALCRGVGWPGATMSHFKARGVVHCALPEARITREGWIGRLRESHWGEEEAPQLVTHVGEHAPSSLSTPRSRPLAFASPGALERLTPVSRRVARRESSATDGELLARLRGVSRQTDELGPRILEATQSYEPLAEYPRGPLGENLRTIAALHDADFGARVYSTTCLGFDAHSTGCGCTTDALSQLSRSLRAFQADLEARNAARDVLIVAYSEFGRRVAENASGGTDHGAAGLTWVIGQAVRGGLYGQRMDLEDLDENGNVRATLDYRQVYASVIAPWFGGEVAEVLQQPVEPLPLLGRA